MPVALARERKGRLLLVAACGVVLVLSGFVGAKVRGQLRSRSEQREVLRDISESELPLDRTSLLARGVSPSRFRTTGPSLVS